MWIIFLPNWRREREENYTRHQIEENLYEKIKRECEGRRERDHDRENLG